MKRLLAALGLFLLLVGTAQAQLSRDGSKSFAPPGSGATLTTLAGTWNWDGPVNTGPDYFVRRNGTPVVPTGYGVLMEVANGGQLYVQNSLRQWYVWRTNTWSATGPPEGTASIQSQVHNAPGWLPGSPYTTGARVNSGPGWNSTTQKWVPYQALRAYQVTRGNCTSGNTQPGNSANPLGSSIPDGSCTWRWLSDTDYVTLTGWGED